MDRNNIKNKIDISNFKEPGEGDCLSMCKKMPIRSNNDMTIVCLSCERIIMRRNLK